MALIKCFQCGHLMSSSASSCPSCGAVGVRCRICAEILNRLDAHSNYTADGGFWNYYHKACLDKYVPMEIVCAECAFEFNPYNSSIDKCPKCGHPLVRCEFCYRVGSKDAMHHSYDDIYMHPHRCYCGKDAQVADAQVADAQVADVTTSTGINKKENGPIKTTVFYWILAILILLFIIQKF